jgi:tetratricopeptide (TPR) repeat protein
MTTDELNELFNQANEDYNNKKFVEAGEKYKTVLDYVPDNTVVWHNYALSLIGLEKFQEAIEALEKPIDAGYTESYLSRGSALRSLGQYSKAMSDFASCFLKEVTNAKAYSNYGNSLREFGMPEVALPFLRTALSLEPNNPTFRLNESVAHLLNGDLINGWKNYDARWFYQSDISFKPELPGTEYNGTQDINGKIICVYSEQGFGDSIQFIRYVKVLQAMGAKILLITRPQLVTLFQYNFPDIDIRTEYKDLSYHYHVPLMELPKCFNTSIDTIPYPDAYLTVSDSLIKNYEKQLGPKTRKRVGIVWSSNSIAFITRFRQVPLEPLLKALADADCETVNIEFDVSSEELELLSKHNVKIVKQDGFDDTAALIKTCDFMVTVDTVYAHLAGALGVHTYVMLADYGMDWRWFLKRKDSPFYNCVKLFRQHSDSDWLSVFNDIKNELKSST